MGKTDYRETNMTTPVMHLKRTYSPKGTSGVLTAKDLVLSTVELPWKGNGQNVSCIPEGEYDYEVKYSNRWKRLVVWLLNVPNRTAIQIHVGNEIRHTLGCILVGMTGTAGSATVSPSVLQSKVALDKLLKTIPVTGRIKISE